MFGGGVEGKRVHNIRQLALRSRPRASDREANVAAVREIISSGMLEHFVRHDSHVSH